MNIGSSASQDATPTADAVVAATRHWLERAVIGLNLCPFAKSVHIKRQIRYAVSAATDVETLVIPPKNSVFQK